MLKKELQEIANIMRRDVLKMTTAAGSGHPTSCLSCAEIISALFFSEMSYDIKNYKNPDNDEFILSKGHAAPILYSALFHAGCINDDLLSLRKFNSGLEGHPMPGVFPWVKVATGSLGQGLGVGVGIALAAKLQKKQYRTYVLMGDGETAEGSVYEAAALAAHYQLDNLCAIIDINRFGQSKETMLGHNIIAYTSKFTALGCEVISVNGHDLNELQKAFDKARNIKEKPTIILAKTLKGKGVSFIEDKECWHGKTLNNEELEKALKEIPDSIMPQVAIKHAMTTNVPRKSPAFPEDIKYKRDDVIATREAYGNALVRLGKADDKIIAIDAEVSNSTFSDKLAKIKPERYVESYIAEQTMITIALGLSVKGFNVFASTFASFLSRAHDQLRMAAISNANLTICGSHAGVSIGEDGPSQMGLEDLGMMRALPESIVFYPSDAVSTEKIMELISKTQGIKYIRASRPKLPVIYDNKEEFEIGGFKTFKSTKQDDIVIIGAGVTLHQALKAREELAKKKINATVIDIYCIKPLNAKKLCSMIMNNGGKAIIVEDHYPEGGIGEAVVYELSQLGKETPEIKCLAVNKISCSGKGDELLHYHGIDSSAIQKEAMKMMKKSKKFISF